MVELGLQDIPDYLRVRSVDYELYALSQKFIFELVEVVLQC